MLQAYYTPPTQVIHGRRQSDTSRGVLREREYEYSLGRRPPRSHLRSAAIRAAVQPHISIDGEGLSAELRQVLAVMDVLQERQKAGDAHLYASPSSSTGVCSIESQINA